MEQHSKVCNLPHEWILHGLPPGSYKHVRQAFAKSAGFLRGNTSTATDDSQTRTAQRTRTDTGYLCRSRFGPVGCSREQGSFGRDAPSAGLNVCHSRTKRRLEATRQLLATLRGRLVPSS